MSNFGNSTLEGGAVYLSGIVHSRMERCDFLNNTAHSGGAVHIGNSGSHVDIVDCSFNANSASDLGGGLYIDSFNTDFSILNVSFLNNTAYSGGGLFINNENTDFLMIECSFHNNVVDGIGGGAFMNSNSVRFIMKRCQFTENSALNYYAGGMYLYSRNEIEMHHVSFISNKVRHFNIMIIIVIVIVFIITVITY